jgi:hypothetical protein
VTDHPGISVDPHALDRLGARISDLGAAVPTDAPDRRVLDVDSVGHAGLAQALQSFVTQWEQRRAAYGQHLEELGQMVRERARAYQAAEDAAAMRFDEVSARLAGGFDAMSAARSPRRGERS